MGTITLRQAAAWCGGTVEEKYADVTFRGASNDTRTLRPGQLFVALQGARDGHEFIDDAMKKGAAAVLCTRMMGDFPAIYVANTRLALGEIARRERMRIGMQVVGITGSVGKSTTKEMVARVLETTFRTAKTPANHNNDIGMPMAILDMPEDTQAAVVEMGMNHFREMAYLSRIARPDLAAIINIGTAHLEYLGSQEGIRKAKMEILEGMAPDARLLLNGDDTLLRSLEEKPEQPILYFGSDERCSVYATDVQQEGELLRFTVHDDGGDSFPVQLHAEGQHYVSDALAAITVGLAMGVEPAGIQAGLDFFRNMAGRQEVLQFGGMTVIKDCYNAGPESMEAALKVLGSKPGRRVAVLGDMLELGACTPAEHYRVGRMAAQKSDFVLAYGPNAARVVSGCLTGGMDGLHAQAFTEKEKLIAQLKYVLKPGDFVLVKGSHGMHMEQIVDALIKSDH
ncbi:MAG: UDP-N-acetylmuramoyl-tripeptide--D-alanyl-D-alanine ligase [Faecousia sp.]